MKELAYSVVAGPFAMHIQIYLVEFLFSFNALSGLGSCHAHTTKKNNNIIKQQNIRTPINHMQVNETVIFQITQKCNQAIL